MATCEPPSREHGDGREGCTPPACDNSARPRLSMTFKPHGLMRPTDPFPDDEIETYHSPEPWTQDGRYIRDSRGAIVVRGRTLADARRIVAAINATRDMPTEALENWLAQDVSDPVRSEEHTS